MRSIFSTFASAALMIAATTPAWATGAPIPVPEPTTMTLIAVGTAAAAVAYRLRGRR